MMSISSKAGKRLAKAKAELDMWKALGGKGDPYGRMLRKSLDYAADEVANELIAAGFHEMEDD